MRALQLISACRFESIEVDGPNEQTLEPGQAIVETLAGGVCGSDLPLFLGAAIPDIQYSEQVRFGPRPWGFPMHEVIGSVVASNCNLKVGDRVVGWAYRNRGLAERVVVEDRSVTPIDSTGDPVAQLVVQPIGCVFHALSRTGNIKGKRVAVLGQGPIGVAFSEVIKAKGAAHVTGVDRVDRTGSGYGFGVDEKVLNGTDRWAYSLSSEDRYDILIEAIGHGQAPLNHAIHAAAEEATIFAFGGIDEQTYGVEMRIVQRRQLSIISGTTPPKCRRSALEQAVGYISTHPEILNCFVTDVFPASEVQAAFEAALNVIPRRIKVAVSWR